MVERFPEVQLLNVYIVEAHPSDGWQVEANEKEDDGTGNLCFMQPQTLQARLSVATRFVQDMELDPSSVVVDGMGNETDLAFEARPERLYVVAGGKILWRSGLGPFQYDTKGLESFLARGWSHSPSPKV